MNDEMGNRTSDAERSIELMALGLPRSVATESDLWPGIAARIDTPEERQIKQLPREIEVVRDLWPEILAGLRARSRTERAAPDTRRARVGIAAAIGLLTLGALSLLYSIQLHDVGGNGVTASAIEPDNPADIDPGPSPIADLLGQITSAAPGTPAAELQEAALLIQRDFLMVRSERLRIEEALANSPSDFNLLDQWRRIYIVELRLINEAQNLGNVEFMRSEV